MLRHFHWLRLMLASCTLGLVSIPCLAQSMHAPLPPPPLLQAASDSVDKLRAWLRDREAGMAYTTYRDGDEFLRQVVQALQTMNGYASAARTSSQTQAAASVGIYDRYFEPKTLVVAPGTTVRWTNHGQHPHTVTAYAGVWDSGEVHPGGSYSITFGTPGTYSYYCDLHPQEMQAMVVVH
jgi:plastocyanin